MPPSHHFSHPFSNLAQFRVFPMRRTILSKYLTGFPSQTGCRHFPGLVKHPYFDIERLSPVTACFPDLFIKRYTTSPRYCHLFEHLFRKGLLYQAYDQSHRKRKIFRTGKFFCFLTEKAVSLRKQFTHRLMWFCELSLLFFLQKPDSEIISFHQTAAIPNTQIFR